MLEKAKEFVANEKKNIIIAVVLLVAVLIAYDVFGSVVSDYESRIRSIRSELDTVKQSQQSAIKRLDTIETGISRSADRVGQVSTGLATNAERIGTIEQRIETSQTRLTTSADLIANCQSILKQVRQRGQE